MSAQTSKVQTRAAASPYPYATAPDIIRAHQKDAYFSGVLANQLTDLHRDLLGNRSAHNWADHVRAGADFLYLALTTLVGNRTLGEEYCDLVQVESPTPFLPFLGGASSPQVPDRLPTIARRASYIALSILLPHAASRALPSFRAALRRRLEARLRTLAAKAGRSKPQQLNKRQPPRPSLEARIERYVLEHLNVITSGAPVQALTLAVFYFGGAYYSLSKRAVGLRYIFTRDVTKSGTPGADRAGYEVLGVLLVVQLAVQGYRHARSVLATPAPVPAASADDAADEELSSATLARERLLPHGLGVEVSLDHDHSYTANNGLLLPDADAGGSGRAGAGGTVLNIPQITNTPITARGGPRYDLAQEQVMGWIKGAQQRRCTLCLEELKDPAATSCGHVFCWVCIGDWVREKPECPLCRREALVQHILPLRTPTAV